MNIQETVPLFLSVRDNPWIPLNKEGLESMRDYYAMMQKTVRAKDNPHRLEIVKHLTQAFFYGSSYQYHKIPDNEKKSKQKILLEKFLDFAQNNYKEHRGLEFYADKLCLTPKYLSKVIKENSGKLDR
jgi:AraC family transcriptional regulator, transcriptional activator of pobA